MNQQERARAFRELHQSPFSTDSSSRLFILLERGQVIPFSGPIDDSLARSVGLTLSRTRDAGAKGMDLRSISPEIGSSQIARVQK